MTYDIIHEFVKKMKLFICVTTVHCSYTMEILLGLVYTSEGKLTLTLVF